MNAPAPLPDDVLAKRILLPQKPAPLILEGRYVRLMPLDLARDTATLHRMSNGSPLTLGDKQVEAYDPEEKIWRWMFAGPFADETAMYHYLKTQVDAPDGLPYTVFDQATQQAVGVANYMRNFPTHLSIELGSIWYSPIAQRTPANLETTYLMLKQAFALGYRRVEWKCDNLNERSKKSALRMGFTFEGIQQAHFIIKNRNRDTAWFRILAHEWDDIRPKLEQLLGYTE